MKKEPTEINFSKGALNKWLDIGSSYLPIKYITSILYSQLIDSKKITKKE